MDYWAWVKQCVFGPTDIKQALGKGYCWIVCFISTCHFLSMPLRVGKVTRKLRIQTHHRRFYPVIVLKADVLDPYFKKSPCINSGSSCNEARHSLRREAHLKNSTCNIICKLQLPQLRMHEWDMCQPGVMQYRAWLVQMFFYQNVIHPLWS